MHQPNRAGSNFPAGPGGPSGKPGTRVPGYRGPARSAPSQTALPDVLDTLRVQYVVLDVERDGDLHRFMHAQPGWSVDFEDGDGAVFARASVTQAEGTNW